MIERASNVEDLRRAFAAGSEKPSAEGGCPEPERLWAAAAGELPVAERRAVILHTAHCPACAEDFRLAAYVAEAAPRAPAVARQRAPAGWWGALTGGSGARSGSGAAVVEVRRWLVGGLASAAVVVVLLVSLQGRFGAGPEVYRAGGEQAIQSLLGAESTLERDAVVLRWEGPEGARYDVFVQTTGLETVSEARDLETTEFQVPAEALADLPAGTRLFWRVEAVLPDGSRLSSPAFDVRLGG